MHLLSTLLAIIISVVASTPVTLDMHATIEELKDPEQAVAHEPITVHGGGTSKYSFVLTSVIPD